MLTNIPKLSNTLDSLMDNDSNNIDDIKSDLFIECNKTFKNPKFSELLKILEQ